MVLRIGVMYVNIMNMLLKLSMVISSVSYICGFFSMCILWLRLIGLLLWWFGISVVMLLSVSMLSVVMI